MHSLARSTVNQYDHRSHVCKINQNLNPGPDTRANQTHVCKIPRIMSGLYKLHALKNPTPKDRRTWTGHTCAPQPIRSARDDQTSIMNEWTHDTNRQREEQTTARDVTYTYTHHTHTIPTGTIYTRPSCSTSSLHVCTVYHNRHYPLRAA